MGLQLDMWTSTESVEREQYACVMMTTVVDPVDTTTTGAQLRFRNYILDFNVFPYSEKTGDNVKSWFLQVLNQNQIKNNMVSDITPDGSVDGQCGLRLIDTLHDNVDTCMLHQLQRAVLWSLGKTGKTCKNPEVHEQLRKNARTVMMSQKQFASSYFRPECGEL
jgi:hypothetical protein